LILALFEHRSGVRTRAGNRVVYDVARNAAYFGAGQVAGRALREPLLAVDVDLDPGVEWLMRCDRVDFPPGGVAYLHTHPGPGIRCLLHGSIRIESEGGAWEYGPGEAWFESGPAPVHATAGPVAETAFVRVLLLPREWAGKRTIRYVNAEDEDKPKTQRATVFLDQPIDL
jgi:quercetin dioxygenase-like cupin family protein